MAQSALLCARRFLSEGNLTKLRAPFSTSAYLRADEPKPDAKTSSYQLVGHKSQEIIKRDEDKDVHKEYPEFYLEVLSGVPEEHRQGRLVRISKPPKNAMQSATDNTHGWLLQFDQRQRWENDLMGWVSSGDPLSSLQLRFRTVDDAVAYCEKNLYPYYIEKAKPVKPKVKSYAHNFSWNKRTRTSTK